METTLEDTPEGDTSVKKIDEIPMHDVPAEDREKVRAAFEKLASGEIPSFVMRAAGVTFDEESSRTDQMLAIATQAAEDATGKIHDIASSIPFAVDHPSQDLGLHADSEGGLAPGETRDYHVHTTPGEQRAHIRTARPGPGLVESEINARLDDRMRELFDQGLTDPDLMEPVVHFAEASGHDTVIFPVTDQPAWHEVTTPDGSRVANVAVIQPPQQTTPAPQRFGG